MSAPVEAAGDGAAVDPDDRGDPPSGDRHPGLPTWRFLLGDSYGSPVIYVNVMISG
jgi:hypothetical protein